MLTDSEDAVAAGTVYLTFRNPAERELQVEAKFQHGHEVRMDPPQIEMTVPAKSEKVVAVAIAIQRSDSHEDAGSPAAALDHGLRTGRQGRLVPERHARYPAAAEPCRSDPDGRAGVCRLAVDRRRRTGSGLHNPLHDGRQPADEVASAAYERPFAIDEATTVQARMFNKEGHGTATSRQTYKPVPAGTGLRYRIYQGSWTRMPNYSELTPVFESVASDLNVESRQLSADNWGMVLDGKFDVDQAGKYTFLFEIRRRQQVVYRRPARHRQRWRPQPAGAHRCDRNMSAGKHKLRIDFFEAGGEAILELDLAGPGMERQPFPVEKVSH